jgi:hypothetical protein
MYTKELESYSTKTADSEEIKELGSKKIIKIFFYLSTGYHTS